jgi:hypothetical protein
MSWFRRWNNVYTSPFAHDSTAGDNAIINVHQFSMSSICFVRKAAFQKAQYCHELPAEIQDEEMTV